MALQVGVLALVAADQAVKALNDGIQQLDQGPSNYLRDGQPQSIPAQIGQAVGRSACRRYAEGDFELSPEASAGYELACRPYLDSLGYGAEPGLALPFRGGQCYVGYDFDFTALNLQGVRSTSPQGTNGRLIGAEVRIDSNGNPVAGFLRQLNPTAQIDFIGLQLGNPGADLDPVISNVRRKDGLPDDCGNPQPVVTQPGEPAAPTPNPEPFNPEPGIDIDLDVTLNFDGSVNFNIGVGIPIVIRPNFDFSPDGSGSGDGGGDGGGTGEPPVPPSSEPGPELPGGNGGFGGDDGFGEPPAGKRWVGCCITITERPPGTGVIPGSVPGDVFPTVVGNLRLVGSSSGNRLVDTPVRILAKHVCVWEPFEGFSPTSIMVDVLPGFGYTYRPYAIAVEP